MVTGTPRRYRGWTGSGVTRWKLNTLITASRVRLDTLMTVCRSELLPLRAVSRSTLNPLIAVCRSRLDPLIAVSRSELAPLIAVSRSRYQYHLQRLMARHPGSSTPWKSGSTLDRLASKSPLVLGHRALHGLGQPVSPRPARCSPACATVAAWPPPRLGASKCSHGATPRRSSGDAWTADS